MALYMLSTEIASCLIRGQSPALDERIASSVPDELCISAVTRGELLCGLSRQMLNEIEKDSGFELLRTDAPQESSRRINVRRYRTNSERIAGVGGGKARGAPSPMEPTTTDSLRRTAHAALARLTPREAAALRSRFGIDTAAGHTLEKISKQFEETRERLRPRTQNVSGVVEQFLNRVSCRPWDAAAATHFARVAVELHRAGTPMSTMDTMIAGHAIAIGAVLVTIDERRFPRVAGLKTENWMVRGKQR